MQYKTIRHSDIMEFDRMVNEAVGEGFKPYGSPYVMPHGKNTFICQAMVKGEAGGSAASAD